MLVVFWSLPIAEDCLAGAKIVFSLAHRTTAALSECVLEHVLDACQFLGSFAAIALRQSSIFPAYKHNLGDAKAKHILLHAIIYSEKATLVPAGNLLKTTERSLGHHDLCMLPSVDKRIEMNAVAYVS